jgi:hypothetical protein
MLKVWRVARSICCMGVAAFLLNAVAARAAGHNGDAMAGHMEMTTLRPLQPGDKARAAAIVVAARKAADPYKDYRKALSDGYSIFLPEVQQNVYHFTNNAQAFRNTMDFDPSRPTSLLYEKVPAKAGGQPGYKLVGVMYTAPYEVSEDELNRRVPLSIARWHLHTNLCMPRDADAREVDDEDIVGKNARFGLRGSITTPEACRAAGGKFVHHVFGWMVHVYPYETNPKKVWASGMDDEHGMQHDAMPADMPME